MLHYLRVTGGPEYCCDVESLSTVVMLESLSTILRLSYYILL